MTYRTMTDSVAHGKATTYTNYGCRCEPCREAQREYQRDYARRNREKLNEKERVRRAKQRAKKPPRTWSRRSVIDRFWEKVDRRDPDACWNWTASTSGPKYKAGGGYGQIGVPGHGNVKAHRLSARIHFGMFDERLMVLHKCDNTLCVNPDHLYLGTAQDNSADMDDRGRRVSLPNEQHPFARLTDAEVAEIRRRHVKHRRASRGTGSSTSELAAEFNVAPSYIVSLVNNQRRVGA